MSYTPPTITGYNSTPPSDDGAATSANRIYWSTIKTKLSDPIKNWVDSINTSINSAFNGLFLAAIDDKAVSFPIGTTDDGKLFNCTSAITVTLPSASDVGEGFHVCVFNSSTGTITIDGATTETINGQLTVSILNKYSSYILICTGSGWIGIDLASYLYGGANFAGPISSTSTISGVSSLNIAGNSTASAVITLAEDTDNGTNKVTITPPQLIASDYTLTLPSDAGTLSLVSNRMIQGGAYAEYSSNADLTVAIPYDDTIPQVGEGTQILSAAITPKTITNKVRVRVNIAGAQSTSANIYLGVAVFVNGGTNAIVAKAVHMPNNAQGSHECVVEYEHSPASTSAQTYTVRVGSNSGNVRLNGTASARIYGGVQVCTITLEEIVE